MSSEHPNRGVLLWASFFTLVAAGMGFAIRAGVLVAWSGQFGFTQFELGQITGGGLVGFGAVILFASLFIDKVGYKPFLVLAFVLHVVSLVMTLAATPIFNATESKDAVYWCLFLGMFMFAVANGICEAVINPLVATIYPRNKTHYLNILHAGWPAGLVLGGFVPMFMGGMRWEIQIAMFLIPTVVYGLMVLPQKFPHSEARAAGLSFGTMLAQFASPILLFLFVLHALVGYVELGTDSWITNITGAILEDPNKGTMLFIYTSTLMFVMRFFAGPIVHRISPLGLLCASGVIGFIGLTMLGSAQTAVMCVVAATVYALGKTFLWPTMLGVVGERFPHGGALTMGAIGGIGMLSAGLLGGPGIGYKQDYYASHQLQEEAPETYERYKADTENSFLFFPPITGLDGTKVGLVSDLGEGLAAEIEVLEGADRDISEVPSLQARQAVWESIKDDAGEDQAKVTAAALHGGRQALKVTAYIPLAMAAGYLLLLFYFKATGGYKAIHLTEDGEEEKIDVTG